MTATTAAPPLPPAQAWHRASHKRPCPDCTRDVKAGDRLAHIDGVDGGRHVCPNCTSTPLPDERKTR